MINSIMPLTNMEKVMLYSYMNEKQSQGYYEQLSFNLSGKVSIEAFVRAYEFIASKYDILRSIYRFQGIEQPVRIVSKAVKTQTQVIDLTKEEANVAESMINIWKHDDEKLYFDLEKLPPHRLAIFKLHEQDYKVYFSFHHILLDGWSLSNLMRTWFNSYQDFEKGKQPSGMAANEKAYYDWIKKQDLSNIKRYWQNELRGYESKSALFLENRQKQPFYAEKSFTLQREAIKNFVQIAHITESAFFQAVWGLLLQKHADSKDVVFSQIISGRNPEIENVESFVGLFIQSIVLRIQTSSSDSVSEFLDKVHETATQANKNGFLPMAEVLRGAHLPEPETMLVFENYPLNTREMERLLGPEITVSDFKMRENVTVPLTIVVVPNENSFSIKLRYNSNRFDEYFIEALCQQVKFISDQILSNPQKLVEDIELEEPSTFLKDTKDQFLDKIPEMSAGERFRKLAEKNSDRTAILNKNTKISYSKLFDAAQRYANVFEKRIPVAATPLIIGDKSPSTVISLLALLCMGRPYTIVDSTEVASRIADICQILKKTVIIGSIANKEKVREICADYIDFDEPEKAEKSQHHFVNSDASDTAYSIFTSGTTGLPKGIEISHANVLNSIRNPNVFSFNKNTVVLQSANLAFDLSEFQIWGALLNGGCLVQCDYASLLSTESISAVIAESKVNTLVLTPSHFKALNLKELENKERLKSLQNVLLGGEIFPEKEATEFKQKFPDVHLYNIYGPAETTNVATFQEYMPDRAGIASCDLGTSIAHLAVTLRNASGKIVPKGVIGEIHIHGRNVAKGYINAASDNFYISEEGIKSYKTGDYAIEKGDGLYFLGRRDNQIKYNGYRITLEEVEIRLSNLTMVESAIAALEDSVLVAYLKVNEGVSFSDVVLEVRHRLPRYMQPKKLFQLNSTSLTQNGKLDHHVEMDGLLTKNKNEELPAVTEKSAAMLQLWKDILEIDQIGFDDNFFDLGGDSLKVITLLGMLSKQFKQSVESKDFLDEPTIKNTLKLIESEPSEKEVQKKVIIYNEQCERIICLFPPSMPLFGYSLVYKNLSRFLDYKIYMFTHYQTESLLDDYVSYIVEHRLDNVILMGYSFGGTIAFEIAQRLQKHNIQIRAILFIDAYVAHENRFTDIHQDEEAYLESIIRDYLKKRNAQEMFHYNKEVTDALITDFKLYNRMTMNINTTMKKLDLDIYQMTTDKPVPWIKDTRKEWRELCRHYITVKAVGEHSEILDTKNLKINAEIVNQLLERIEQADD